jgi:hypothetical protein
VLDRFDLLNAIGLDSSDILNGILDEEKPGEEKLVDKIADTIKNATSIDEIYDLTKSFASGKSTFTPPRFGKGDADKFTFYFRVWRPSFW